jgi:adenylosuccinate synthase
VSARIAVVLGLGFGDEGKGSLVDWLARRADAPPLVVRWNGGPQAAHHVVTDDGRTHCFAQFGAASFVPGARTHLGPEMAVDPYAVHREAEALARVGVPDALAGLTIDPGAVLATPWHAIVNRVRELARGGARHGTTGRGVAEAKLGRARLCAGQLGRGLAAALEPLRRELAETARGLAVSDEARALAARADDRDLIEVFLDAAGGLEARVSAALPAADAVILEGAQGALLDRDHGFFPHVTPSRVTRAAAEEAARALGLVGALEVWGVLRAYHTRHGEGPLPSEDAALTLRLPELHNEGAGWAGAFRVGWFDAVLARHALACAGPVDRLALTCLDRLAEPAVVDAWEPRDLAGVPASERTAVAWAARVRVRRVPDLVGAVEEALGQRVALESHGPTAAGKRPR